MKEKLKIAMLLGICILAGGCTMNSHLVEGIAQSEKGKVDHKDVNVSTEVDMKDYALKVLEEKYGQAFEIASILKYDHKDGEENKPMYLNGYAHVIGNEDLDCYFVVTEPNEFVDDFATNYYKEAINKQLSKDFSDLSNEYDIFIDHDLTDKVFDPKMDYQKYLYNKQCCIDVTVYVPYSEDAHDYISVIRAWMDKLYGAKYDWYFELHDQEDKDKCYFTLDPGDNGFDSADDWSDELIYDYIEK